MARPSQLGKGSKFVVLAAVCIVVAALYFAQDVLIPLALAVLFCFLLAPLVTRIEHFGLARVPAVMIVVLAATGVVVAIGYATTIQIYNLADRLPDYRGEISEKTRNLTQYFGSSGGIVDKMKSVADDVQKASTQPASTRPTTSPATTQSVGDDPVKGDEIAKSVEQVAADPLGAAAREAVDAPTPESPPLGTTKQNPVWAVALPEPSSPIRTLGTTLGVVLSPLGTAGLVLVFIIFMLIQREDLRNRLIRLVGQGQLNVTTSAFDDAASRMSRYMLAQAIVNGTYGVAIAIGLWAIGQFVGDKPFPSFVLWGLLCAVLRFIPYVGPWVAAAFPILLSAAVFHGFTPFFLTLGMFVVVELLSNNLMEPWLYGTSTGMSTVAILVSAVFWTWLWGPVGLLLATPMTVCLVVLGKYVPQLQFLDILLGDEQVLEPSERLYQRLLALDQEEAADVAQAHLKGTSLEQVYDEVVLPALAMAEQDRHRGRMDEEHEVFVRQAMREIIEELGDAARAVADKQAGDDIRDAAASNVAVAKGEAPGDLVTRKAPSDNASGTAPARMRAKLPGGCTVNVVCLPARDEGDDIANQMLAQLLTLGGYCAVPIPVAALASEMVEAVNSHNADVVVVSALPPGAVSYSRYLCKRLHVRYPEMPMAVGLWTIKGDLKKAKDRIACAADVRLAPTFGDMLDLIHQLSQSAIVRTTGVAAEQTAVKSESSQ